MSDNSIHPVEQSPELAAPPRAARRPHHVTSPHGTRIDEYYWLRDDERADPEVLDYLNQENRWFEQNTRDLADLKTALYREIRARIKEDDSSPPVRYRDYLYYARFETGGEYPIHARRRAESDTAVEEVMLDVNHLALGHEYFQVGNHALGHGQQLLAWAEDSVGRRQYTIRFKNLASGEMLNDALHGTSGALAWSSDDRYLFYVENDPNTLRSWKVRRHQLGQSQDLDETVYVENDESFYTDVSLSGSELFIVISVSSTVSDEQWVLDAANPLGSWTRIAERARDFHYSADHIGQKWVIRTDWNAPDYCLMEVAQNDLGDRHRWKLLVAQDPAVFINDFALFSHYFVVDERSAGLRRLRVRRWDGTQEYFVASDEEAYTAQIDANPSQETNLLRFRYTSLTTPSTVCSLDMVTGVRTVIKEQVVLGGFDRENYVTRRLWAQADDGRAVPISVVHHRDTVIDGTAPLFQYGYGAYGICSDPQFRSSLVSLLDRGFVYAIAHVRGGEEMGRAWYEEGKKLLKSNSFTDFIAVTRYLLAAGYARPDAVFAQGGSAGGLLMGAVINLAGELYRGVVADVPFVDVVTTMLDESIPLTTNEYDEWGNPNEAQFYQAMLAYSPYDNVVAKSYPALLVTTGLHDSQVQYFEPAKWVAKLRHLKTDAHPLYLKTNMEAGHGGRSGRLQAIDEIVEEFAFILGQLGLQRAAR